MKLLPAFQIVFDDVVARFHDRIEPVAAPAENEAYLRAPMDVVGGFCAYIYKKWQGRLVGVFGEDLRAQENIFLVNYLFAVDSAHGFLILQAPVAPEHPEFPSLTNAVHAVNWQEREVQDMFGLQLIGHPNPRRCALHDDWPNVHPLRKDFALGTKLPEFTGERHKFRIVEGEGVFQVPVGPVHAGIIEPGHFLFSVAGEPVLYLQLRLFYVHKGTEKLFENLPIAHGVRLAESISGDSSFAHATAFCHAIERAAETDVPVRARALRSLCLELERIYNHIADIGAIATDVAFTVGNAQAMRLKEKVLRLNESLTGNRLLRGMACLGGVRFDFSADQLRALAQTAAELEPDFQALVEMIQNSASTLDRLDTTGILKPELAKDLGIVGIAGRASGFNHDLRRDFPHAAYDRVKFIVPLYLEGDVTRRMQVRIDEVGQSFSIIRQLLENLPDGKIAQPVLQVPPDQMALGYAEGWRGEIFHWVRTAPGNRLHRCKIKDPSLQNWPALSEAILGNIVPDFPVVNKSFNLSYSGNDR